MNINSARANHSESACRAPVDTFVRHRVLCYAAATAAAPPTLTRINPQSTTARLHTETDCILVGAAASVYSTHFVRDCLTPSISGAASRIDGAMRNSLRGLRCMQMLDAVLCRAQFVRDELSFIKENVDYLSSLQLTFC